MFDAWPGTSLRAAWQLFGWVPGDERASLATKSDNAISLASKRGKLVSLNQASEFGRLGLPGGAAWAY